MSKLLQLDPVDVVVVLTAIMLAVSVSFVIN